MRTDVYDGYVWAAAARHDVPAAWIKAVIGTESSFNPNVADRWEAKVKEYAYGPMQILLSTARFLGFTGTAAELRRPETNIEIGARYIARLRSTIGDNFARIYSAYNSGNPDRYLTSDQVRANVERALTWLAEFDTVDTAAIAIAIGLGLGVMWWAGSPQKGKRR